MKFILLFQRFLSYVIDLILILIILQLFFTITFSSYFNTIIYWNAFYFSTLLYNILSIHYFSGKTVGKYFANIKVNFINDSMLEVGQREVVKILYLFSYIGLILILISFVVYFFKNKTLHDLVGRSEVLFDTKE